MKLLMSYLWPDHLVSQRYVHDYVSMVITECPIKVASYTCPYTNLAEQLGSHEIILPCAGHHTTLPLCIEGHQQW